MGNFIHPMKDFADYKMNIKRTNQVELLMGAYADSGSRKGSFSTRVT